MRKNKTPWLKAVVIVVALLVFCTHSSAQKICKYHDKQFIYKLTLDSVLSGDSVNYQCSVRMICILKRSNHQLVQTINPPENYFFCDINKKEIFVAEDMNFDGVNDIRLIQFIPAAPNTPYYYWMYNNTTHQFQRNKAFDNITTPEFDRKQKLIISSWRGGWANYGSSTYKIINGKPVLIEEYETKELENDSTKHILTQKKRINGKLRLVKTTIEDVSDNK